MFVVQPVVENRAFNITTDISLRIDTWSSNNFSRFMAQFHQSRRQVKSCEKGRRKRPLLEKLCTKSRCDSTPITEPGAVATGCRTQLTQIGFHKGILARCNLASGRYRSRFRNGSRCPETFCAKPVKEGFASKSRAALAKRFCPSVRGCLLLAVMPRATETR